MTREHLKITRLLKNSLPVLPTLVLDGRNVAAASGFLSEIVADRENLPVEAAVPDYAGLPLQILDVKEKTYLVITRDIPMETAGKAFTAAMFVPLEGRAGDAGIFGTVAVMLIFVDNYDEVIETVEEIRRPVLPALIERKLGLAAKQSSAILRRFEKDKYLMILTEDKLEALKAGRFAILSAIREIDIGNKIPITLSIGVGTGGLSLAHNMDNARAAIDLALGRGGGQALVKDGDKYLFYGGDTPEIPQNDAVKARVKLYALNELFAESSNVIIMGHKRMDMDCLGAAVGVKKLAERKNRECYILMDEINPGIGQIYDKLVKETGYEGIIINEEKALGLIGEGSLVVLVDANRPGQVQSQRILEKAARLVILDHHRLAADFIAGATLTYQEPHASSVCELICGMMTYSGNIRFAQAEADLMLAGITVDTKNFTQKAGVKTFEAAAYLKRGGADSARVRKYLQESFEDVAATAKAVAGAVIINGAAFAVCSKAGNPVQASARAADELLSAAGVCASFAFCRLEDENAVYVSARSLGKVNVQTIMEKLGGGGHQTMAAATLAGTTVKAAKERVMGMLEQHIL
ncbi:MAG: DHH family phosphoesterase [Clostridiales bacterium]|jgi:c-di-AMP phosphodiesterase-like protein|nr:DHH family phosphoesterase [Clostridiales bacterium]